MSDKLEPAAHPSKSVASTPPLRTKGHVDQTVVLEEKPQSLSDNQLHRVDALQDAIMENTSADGRPPTHQQRRIGWGVVLIVGLLMFVLALAWAIISGVSFGFVVGVSIVCVIVLVAMGTPVWAAGVSRGAEEASARSKAMDRVQPVKVIEPGVVTRKQG